MKKLSGSIIVMCVFSMLLLSACAHKAPSGSQAKDGVKTGTLTVTAVPGTTHNLIVKSSVDVKAVFDDNAGNKEYYVGEMGIKLGLDLSVKSEEQLVYAVFSASSAYKTGSYALAGKYFGQEANVALGVGGGVKVLIGGFDKSFTLQPLALTGSKGYGAEVGIGYLYLQKDPK